jgi:dTDP-4-amino-4,6-dideoxygalactose transaminase
MLKRQNQHFMINVTKTFLPPLEEYIPLLREIWSSRNITNHGKFVLRLEQELKDYLNVKHLFLVNNGTIALQIAYKALQITGKVITTPFSYVATVSSLVWEGLVPEFADIDQATFCIDPKRISECLSQDVTAILATHVYGNPCDLEELAKIASTNHLKLIYDGAHAFGVSSNGSSVLSYGDISTISFHATKLFHTAEGGAIITSNDELAHRISYLRNFGHNGPENFWGMGINGKLSELNAALGICILPKVNELILRRRDHAHIYDHLLSNQGLRNQEIRQGTGCNYAYYPVVFPTETKLLLAIKNLNEKGIFPRRYFYPSLNCLDYLPYKEMPVSEDIACRILCLPIFFELTEKEIKTIAEIIIKSIS